MCQISDTSSYINTLTKINVLNPDEVNILYSLGWLLFSVDISWKVWYLLSFLKGEKIVYFM